MTLKLTSLFHAPHSQISIPLLCPTFTEEFSFRRLSNILFLKINKFIVQLKLSAQMTILLDMQKYLEFVVYLGSMFIPFFFSSS